MTLPRKSTLISNIQRGEDSRGDILSIVNVPIKNVSIINCNPGSIRSNHYHLKDFHYMYVLEGDFDYFYKDVDTGAICHLKVHRGETIFTPPLEVHACYFPDKTTLIVSSKNPRDRETYEADTIRVELISLDNITDMLAAYGEG